MSSGVRQDDQEAYGLQQQRARNTMNVYLATAVSPLDNTFRVGTKRSRSTASDALQSKQHKLLGSIERIPSQHSNPEINEKEVFTKARMICENFQMQARLLGEDSSSASPFVVFRLMAHLLLSRCFPLTQQRMDLARLPALQEWEFLAFLATLLASDLYNDEAEGLIESLAHRYSSVAPVCVGVILTVSRFEEIANYAGLALASLVDSKQQLQGCQGAATVESFDPGCDTLLRSICGYSKDENINNGEELLHVILDRQILTCKTYMSMISGEGPVAKRVFGTSAMFGVRKALASSFVLYRLLSMVNRPTSLNWDGVHSFKSLFESEVALHPFRKTVMDAVFLQAAGLWYAQLGGQTSHIRAQGTQMLDSIILAQGQRQEPRRNQTEVTLPFNSMNMINQGSLNALNKSTRETLTNTPHPNYLLPPPQHLTQPSLVSIRPAPVCNPTVTQLSPLLPLPNSSGLKEYKNPNSALKKQAPSSPENQQQENSASPSNRKVETKGESGEFPFVTPEEAEVLLKNRPRRFRKEMKAFFNMEGPRRVRLAHNLSHVPVRIGYVQQRDGSIIPKQALCAYCATRVTMTCSTCKVPLHTNRRNREIFSCMFKWHNEEVIPTS